MFDEQRITQGRVKHRDRSLMKTRKVLGRAQAVCAPSCSALDDVKN